MEHYTAVKKRDELYDKIWKDIHDTVLSEKSKFKIMYMKCHFC